MFLSFKGAGGAAASGQGVQQEAGGGAVDLEIELLGKHRSSASSSTKRF